MERVLLSIFLIIAVIGIILRSNIKGIISMRSRTEIMFLGLIFIVASGIFLHVPYLNTPPYITSFELSIVIIGFILGLIGFLKK